jgi:hypothetical protein
VRDSRDGTFGRELLGLDSDSQNISAWTDSQEITFGTEQLNRGYVVWTWRPKVKEK